ncbi:hypothetical protein ACFQXA_03965 [Nocardiopsis composta]
MFADTGAEYVRRLGARTVPWSEVPKHRFDLAVAASLGMLASVAAPILEVGHGTGPGKLLPRIGGHGAPLRRPAAGAAPGGLTAYGRLLPTVIGVPHERHRALLSASVPEAAEAVRVVGDPCHDRLLAGLAARDRYRRALGAGPGDLLVLLTSTGGRHSCWGAAPTCRPWSPPRPGPQAGRCRCARPRSPTRGCSAGTGGTRSAPGCAAPNGTACASSRPSRAGRRPWSPPTR